MKGIERSVSDDGCVKWNGLIGSECEKTVPPKQPKTSVCLNGKSPQNLIGIEFTQEIFAFVLSFDGKVCCYVDTHSFHSLSKLFHSVE